MEDITTEEEFERALEALLLEPETTEEYLGDIGVCTFDRQGMLTKNRGLVITLADGSEYQLTIVQSRSAR